MGFYERYVLPRLTHCACGSAAIMRQRRKVTPHAQGRVLEIGAGSGRNFPLYDVSKVNHVWALEPSPGMLRLAAKLLRRSRVPVEFIRAPAEAVPLEDESADTVVMTYTLCSIALPAAALAEMARVLKAGGELLFCEHGAAPDASVRRWQKRLTPWWKRFGGGCHLDRPIPSLIEMNGFRIVRLESGYVSTPRITGFMYWGAAVRAVSPKLLVPRRP